MASVKDFITFNNKWYTELTSKDEREHFETLAEQLAPLEQQLNEHPKANINILDDLSITTKNLPAEIASKIEGINIERNSVN